MANDQTYDIDDDDDEPKPAAPIARRPAKAAPDAGVAGAGGGGDHDDDDDDDLLPPPLSPETNVRVWLVVAGVATAFLAVSWLAGARALAPIEATADGSVVRELGFGARLVGLARTLVFLPLSTLAIGFGVLSLAFVRQRPIGDGIALLARCAAIAAIGMLAWLVPVEVRFLKQMVNVMGPPLTAGALAMPVFKLDVRDAGLVVGFTVLGVTLLTLFALVIVWAVGA